jgi:chemotaxis protein MotB
MRADAKPTIVVRRMKRRAAAHHGGAWKIAYADFVTAMMAFFLLMWLLGSTTQGELQGIADYFRTPLKVALAGGSGSGDSSSVVRGGGHDLSRTHGQIARTDRPEFKRTINLQAAQADIKRELQKLRELRVRMQEAIENHPTLSQLAGQIRIDVTDEGLRIQLVDEKNRPMFDTGSARLKDYARDALSEVAHVLVGVENRLSISGHTDAQPYAGGQRGYSNWELSADRANAARRELLAAGLTEQKMIRVVGLADSQHLNRADPFDPANRRISIVVMTKKAEQDALGTGKAVP